MDLPRLDIAFVSDVACPWCAIGLASLEQALERLHAEVETTIRVEPFELNPDMGSEGAEVVPYLARKYGRTAEQVAQAQARIRERGAAVGFSFGDRKHVWNTFNAHRILHWAGLEGVRWSSSVRCCVPTTARAAIRARRTCSWISPQRSDWMRSARDRFWTAMSSPRRCAVENAYWLQRGVAGVPLVVVNDSHAIEGAETPDGYERALRQIAQGVIESSTPAIRAGWTGLHKTKGRRVRPAF
jgi:predicted DsbA family dithiol-disulfide isomerase